MYAKLFLMGLISLFLTSVQTTAMAETSVNTEITPVQYVLSEITLSGFQKLTTDQQKTVAGEWNLSLDDYTHYLQLMATTQNGLYYQDRHLDPSVILGFNAKDEVERRKFAMIAIHNEQARVEKELSFQKTFYHLQRELFPDQKPIADTPMVTTLSKK